MSYRRTNKWVELYIMMLCAAGLYYDTVRGRKTSPEKIAKQKVRGETSNFLFRLVFLFEIRYKSSGFSLP